MIASFALKTLLRPELAELRPYLPHDGQYTVRLDANEAPPLLSARARERLSEVAAQTMWQRYPDATQHALRQAIALRCGVQAEEVSVGVGSDELITLLLTILTNPQKPASTATVMTMAPTFVMYRSSARARGWDVVEAPLDAEWDIDEGACLRALEQTQPNLVFIASPNNPTGNLVDKKRLARFVEAAERSLVVIDEAYVDYAESHQLEFLRRYENVAILRTLSKVGFAALRVGWLLGRPELIGELEKARLPYNIPSPCQALATCALTELSGEIDRTCQSVVAERQRVASAMKQFSAIRMTPSQANFLWFEFAGDASTLFKALGRRGVLVRSFHSKGGRLAHCLRVTIGTPEENDAFLKALEDALRS